MLGYAEPTAIRIDYQLQAVVVSLNVPLAKQRLPRGGFRWWGFCPRCGRRIGKLHMPAGQHEFACRHCYGLTYLARRNHDPSLKRLVISLLGVDLKTLSFKQQMYGLKSATQFGYDCDAEQRREKECEAHLAASLQRRRTRRRLRKSSTPQA